MIAQRVALLLAGAASMAAFTVPATAQVADDVVLSIMRECARIDEPSARLGCYDNNIRSAGASPRATVPGETVVQGSGAVLNGPQNRGNFGNRTGVGGFGGEDVEDPGRFQVPDGEIQELTATVAQVRQIGAGRYVLTLEDGAVWRFTDTVSNIYRVPRPGSEVEINRAAMGSFLMRFRDQQSVRIERVR